MLAVDAEGALIGGAILPGPQMSLAALVKNTAQLPQVELDARPRRVLGANTRARELLRQMKQRASLPVLTKGADVRKLGPEAERFFRAEARCTDLYALACPNPPAPGAEYRTDPVIL